MSMLELIDKICPICKKESLVLGLPTTEPDMVGLVDKIKEIDVYCSNGRCSGYEKIIAKKVK